MPLHAQKPEPSNLTVQAIFVALPVVLPNERLRGLKRRRNDVSRPPSQQSPQPSHTLAGQGVAMFLMAGWVNSFCHPERAGTGHRRQVFVNSFRL
jgi:hypothetical protein